MAEHIFGMEGLSSLVNAGHQLDENLMVAMILRSLLSLYHTLTTTLESRLEDELTLEKVGFRDESRTRGEEEAAGLPPQQKSGLHAKGMPSIYQRDNEKK